MLAAAQQQGQDYSGSYRLIVLIRSASIMVLTVGFHSF